MVKIIIFDIGGVVYTQMIDSKKYMAKEILERTGVNLFPADSVSLSMSSKYKEFSQGKITSEMYFQNLIDLSKANVSVEKLMAVYKELFLKNTKANPKMVNLIKKLHKNYAVACLTVTNEFHRQINEERGLFKMFDFSFTSSQLGMLKNEDKVFRIVTEKLGVNPEDCIFIDDIEEHVKRAMSVGIDGIHFTGYKNLVAELKLRNIKF